LDFVRGVPFKESVHLGRSISNDLGSSNFSLAQLESLDRARFRKFADEPIGDGPHEGQGFKMNSMEEINTNKKSKNAESYHDQ